MNSIDKRCADAALNLAMAALFDEVLMPIASRMHGAGEQAFALGPDVSWLSYYARRRRSVAAPDDFTSASCAGAAEFERRLAAHWHAMGRHALLAHVARFGQVAELARTACSGRGAQPELSPYVYAMF